MSLSIDLTTHNKDEWRLIKVRLCISPNENDFIVLVIETEDAVNGSVFH